MAKIIEYRGVIYRRYEGRLYYNPSGTLLTSGKGTSLHRQVWLDAGNRIPKGWHVHHIDGDHDNNDISNLECLPARVHSAMHLAERREAVNERIRAFAASPEGKLVRLAAAHKMLANTPTRSCKCAHCGRAFKTKHPRKQFCSAECQASVPNATCEICGAPFRSKPHSTKRVRTCSYQCGWELRRRIA